MDFYIKTFGDPNHDPRRLDLSSEISQLITQLETLFFTKRGEVLGNLNFGLDLEKYIYTLQYNPSMLRSEVETQIYNYIPLAKKYNVQVDVDMADLHSSVVMYIDVTIDSTYQIRLEV